MATATISDRFRQYDQINVIDPNIQTAAEKDQLSILRNRLETDGVHPKWLTQNLSIARSELEKRDLQLSKAFYQGLADPNVYLDKPQEYTPFNLFIYSPRLFFKRRIKKPIGRAGIATLFATSLFTNPLVTAGFVAVAPLAQLKKALEDYEIEMYFKLQPYLAPGQWLEDAIKRTERRLLFSILPGAIGRIPPFSRLFKTYHEPTIYGLRPVTAFRPTHGFKLAVADFIGKDKSQVAQNISSRLKTRRKDGARNSLIAALTIYVFIEAIKRILGEKALQFLAKVTKPLKFLKRGKAFFSINAGAGGILGAGLGSLVGLPPLAGAALGWLGGGSYQLYRDLASGPKVIDPATGRVRLASLVELEKEQAIFNQGRLPQNTFLNRVGVGKFYNRLRLVSIRPAKWMAESRLWRLPIKGGLLAFGLQQAGLITGPQALMLTGAWYGWNDLRPWLFEKGFETIVRRVYGRQIISDLNLGVSPKAIGLAEFNTWMRLKHPYWLRLFRALPSGGIAGTLAGGAAALLGVPVPIAVGIGAGVGAGVTAANFGIRALNWKLFESSSLTSASKLGRFGFVGRLGGKALGVAGWGYMGAEALSGAETGKVFGFSRIHIPGTNIDFSFGGTTGKLANFGITTSSGAMIGATVGTLGGPFAPITVPVGAAIGAAAGAITYGVNEVVIRLTGHSIPYWAKQGVQVSIKGFKNLPTWAKGAVAGGGAGFVVGGVPGAIIGGAIGAFAQPIWNFVTGIPIIGGAIQAVGNWFGNIVGGIAGLFGWGKEHIVDPLAEWAAGIAANFANVLIAFATAVMTLLSGGDIYQAAVSLAIALILIFALIGANLGGQAGADAFLNLSKSASPAHVENNQLPAPIEFRIKLEAKDKPLQNIECVDEITAAGLAVPHPTNCPQTLAAGEVYEQPIFYTIPNQPQFHDSIIVNKISVDFDVDLSSTQNVNPNQDNCGGRYTLTNPLGNYGDPNCNYNDNDLYLELQAKDPVNADYWFYAVVPCETVNRNDGAMDPNSYNASSTSGQALGLYQMGHIAYPSFGLDYQVADDPDASGDGYDRGDVEWHLQTSNAINYNNQIIGGSFAYWPSYSIGECP